jgi:hypothetical protein
MDFSFVFYIFLEFLGLGCWFLGVGLCMEPFSWICFSFLWDFGYSAWCCSGIWFLSFFFFSELWVQCMEFGPAVFLRFRVLFPSLVCTTRDSESRRLNATFFRVCFSGVNSGGLRRLTSSVVPNHKVNFRKECPRLESARESRVECSL